MTNEKLSPLEAFHWYRNIKNYYYRKPKELSEFRKTDTLSLKELQQLGLSYNEKMYKDMMIKGKLLITKAPQSMCYVEELL